MHDYASMIGELQRTMSRNDIAAAIGVEPPEIDEIASGYQPDEEIGERLRALAEGGGSTSGRRIPVWAIVAFVVFDTLLFGILLLVFLVR